MIKKYIILFFLIIHISSCSQNKDYILFSSSVNGNSDIFIMDAKGDNKNDNYIRVDLHEVKKTPKKRVYVISHVVKCDS